MTLLIYKEAKMAATAIIEEKAKQVEEIKQKIQSAKSIVLVDYMGLTVSEDTELKRHESKQM